MLDHTTSNEQGTSSSKKPKNVQSSSRKRPAQALNSKVVKRKNNMIASQTKNQDWLDKVPECPVYTPTREEFQDPLAYIRSKQRDAEHWGICKIIPPVTPAVPGGLVCRELDGAVLKFTTREQPVRERVWNDMDEGKFTQTDAVYTLQSYSRMAEEFQRRQMGAPGSFPARMVEDEYWRQRSIATELKVEYGNDVEGTAFCSPSDGDPLGSTDWNLQVLPRLEKSTLRLLKGEVPGITTPMLYIGMLYATFAWHVEDHYLYSINYQHLGASKTWYGVPGNEADGFEEVAERQVYARALQAENLRGGEASVAAHRAILGKTTMFSPQLLLDAGVRVCRAVQQPGEFIVTFPRAYHAGFSNGFCVGEAVNFAMHDWYQFGADCCLRYRRLNQPPILPHDELICEEALLLSERLKSAQGASSPADPAANLSLAGTFVSLLRQQNKQRFFLVQRRNLTQRPLPTDVDGGMLSNDCAQCAHMCFLTVVVAEADKEPMCMECAMRENVMGPRSTLFCHPELDSYEQCARWFEQQPLLTNADWEGTLRNRGLTEDELHHSGWGHHCSRTVPPPNQRFTWEDIPPPHPAPELEVTLSEHCAVGGELGSARTTIVVLGPNNNSLPRTRIIFPQNGPIQGDLGGLPFPPVHIQPALAAPFHPGDSAASDSNISIDVVGLPTVRDTAGESSNSGDATSADKEPTPTSTLDSGTALCARLSPKDAAADSGQPSPALSQQPEQPSTAGAHPSSAANSANGGAAAQPQTAKPATPAAKANAARATSKQGKKKGAAEKVAGRPKATPSGGAWKGPLQFYSGEGGSVRLASDEMIKAGGNMARRRVYELQEDPSQLFVRARDLTKAGGMLRTGSEGARDIVRYHWKLAAEKAQAVAAAGLAAPELPLVPLHYTGTDERDIGNTFMVGLDHVARVFYWLANPKQRRVLEQFCKGVWSEDVKTRATGLPDLPSSPLAPKVAKKKIVAAKRGRKEERSIDCTKKGRAAKRLVEQAIRLGDEEVAWTPETCALVNEQVQHGSSYPALRRAITSGLDCTVS